MAGSKDLRYDDIDMRIVGSLITDARQSFRQISRSLGISVATVASRVERLEKRGVIRRYSALLDYEKIGFAFPVIIEVKVAHGKLFDAERRIAQDPHVCMVLDHTGGTDATVIARFRNRDTLDRFVKKIQSIPNVERTETKLVLNVIKDEPTGV